MEQKGRRRDYDGDETPRDRIAPYSPRPSPERTCIVERSRRKLSIVVAPKRSPRGSWISVATPHCSPLRAKPQLASAGSSGGIHQPGGGLSDALSLRRHDLTCSFFFACADENPPPLPVVLRGGGCCDAKGVAEAVDKNKSGWFFFSHTRITRGCL